MTSVLLDAIELYKRLDFSSLFIEKLDYQKIRFLDKDGFSFCHNLKPETYFYILMISVVSHNIIYILSNNGNEIVLLQVVCEGTVTIKSVESIKTIYNTGI